MNKTITQILPALVENVLISHIHVSLFVSDECTAIQLLISYLFLTSMLSNICILLLLIAVETEKKKSIYSKRHKTIPDKQQQFNNFLLSTHLQLYIATLADFAQYLVLLSSEALRVSSAFYTKLSDQGVSRMKKFNLSRPALFYTQYTA